MQILVCFIFCIIVLNNTISDVVNIYDLSSVIGALIGKQEGRNIEVMNSFELLSHTIDDRVHIDKEYYYTKEEQCKWFVCVRIWILLCFCYSVFISKNKNPYMNSW